MELRIARTTASFELLEFTTGAFIVRFGGFFTTVCSTGFSTFGSIIRLTIRLINSGFYTNFLWFIGGAPFGLDRN